jgi:hypothetical protein
MIAMSVIALEPAFRTRPRLLNSRVIRPSFG